MTRIHMKLKMDEKSPEEMSDHIVITSVTNAKSQKLILLVMITAIE